MIDLHLHSTRSDGTLTPEQLLHDIRLSGLTAFALTDHDTVQGCRDLQELMKPGDPELIVGVELSCSLEDGDIHLLGYMLDLDCKPFNQALTDFQEVRNKRGLAIVEKLSELGLTVDYQLVANAAGGAAVGRPHIAQAMVEASVVNTYEEAFYKYIKTGGPAYVPKKNLTPKEGIDLIHMAGGLAVLAHPVLEDAQAHIELLSREGLDGVEIYHPVHKRNDIDRLRYEASRFRLLVTGGSDFHGRASRHGAIGSQKVPDECLSKMKQLIQQRQVSH